MTSNKVILFVILQHFQQSQSYERSLLLCTLESISSHLLLLLLYLRVKLPWTAAFAAVPIICFGFQVCIKFQLGTSCSCNLQRSLGLNCFFTLQLLPLPLFKYEHQDHFVPQYVSSCSLFELLN